MKVTLACAGDFDALMLEGWRIPRRHVETLQDAAAGLASLERRVAARHQTLEREAADARTAGYRDGFAEGLARAEEQTASQMAGLLAAASERAAALEASLGRMVHTVVRRFCGELDQDELLARIAAETFKQLIEDRPVAVRARNDVLARLAPLLADVDPLRFVADAAAPEGRCIFEMAEGSVVCGPSLQLKSLEAALERHANGKAAK